MVRGAVNNGPAERVWNRLTAAELRLWAGAGGPAGRRCALVLGTGEKATQKDQDGRANGRLAPHHASFPPIARTGWDELSQATPIG